MSSPLLWCRTIGGLTLHLGDDAGVSLVEAGKPLALVAFLGLSSTRQAERDRVAELLWPGVPLSDARHSLRQAAYRLRRAASGERVVSLDGTRVLLSDRVRLDCAAAEDALAGGDISTALSLLEGSFLEGFEIPGSREFEEWCEAQRTRFRTAWASAANVAAAEALAVGDAEAALSIAERLQELKPFDDEPIRLVMAALAAGGMHAKAVSRYAAFAEVLSYGDESPATELSQYARELDEYVRSRGGYVGSELPFVGRAGEWCELETLWRQCQSSAGGMVLVEGAAGLGKTRLVRELQRRVTAAGGLVLEAKGYEPEQSVSYGVVGDLFSGAVDHPELAGLNPTLLSEAARLVPELREQFAALPDSHSSHDGGGSKRRLHQALARCLEALSRSDAVLLTVDDVHWADRPSLEVLHFLSHRVQDAAVLIVATYRPAELGPFARRFARSLTGSGLSALVTLDAFRPADVEELVGEMGDFGDEAVAHTLAGDLHRQSGGNPLFLSELLDELARRRVVFVRGGRWHLGEGVDLGAIPNTIGKLLMDRIDRLEPWMRACVELIAVSSGDLSVEAMAGALAISEPRAELALSVLEEERLVRRARSGAFDLIHDELRRLAYQGIPDDRRRALHASLGKVLAESEGVMRPGGAARLAYHFDQAGMLEEARSYSLLAAREASALEDTDASQSHLERAAAHAPRPLPPGASSGRRSHRTVRALVVGTAAVAIVAGGLAVAGWTALPAWVESLRVPDYVQGMLLLVEGPGESPTHRVAWPQRGARSGTVVPVAARKIPHGVSAFSRQVPDGQETHSQTFLVRDGDTTQITFGRMDHTPQSWSPDRQHLIVTRGWKQAARFPANLWVLDSAGVEVGRLTEHLDQDDKARWSPLGDRITFWRVADGRGSVWVMDADGGMPVNLSEEVGLPLPGWALPSFSPDGRSVAILEPDRSPGADALYVVDVVERTYRLITQPARSQLEGHPLWSPDGQWIAYTATLDGEIAVWVVEVSGGREAIRITSLPPGLRLDEWRGEEPRHVDMMKVVEGSDLALSVGTGRRLRSDVTFAGSVASPLVIRWASLDHDVVHVDSLGFARGRRPGVTRVIASAGGFRADTVSIVVSESVADTLFFEDWRDGLDSARWGSFGYPAPVTVPRPGGAGRVFGSNGDYNHVSGAVTRGTVEWATDGLTLESEAWVAFDGRPWQWMYLGVSAQPGPPTEFETNRPGDLVYFGLEGPEPSKHDHPHWVCGSAFGPLDPGTLQGRWIPLALQLRSDSVLECFVDGRLVARRDVRRLGVGSALRIVLEGQSVDTEVLHGRVLVTRGLRY